MVKFGGKSEYVILQTLATTTIQDEFFGDVIGNVREQKSC